QQEIDRRPEDHLDDGVQIERDVEGQRAEKEHGRSRGRGARRAVGRSLSQSGRTAKTVTKGNQTYFCPATLAAITAEPICRAGRIPRTSAATYLVYSVNSTLRASRSVSQAPPSSGVLTTG